MDKCNSIETTDRKNLTEQAKFRLDEINKIENYFHQEINQRKSCSKKLSKYATFDYIDKVLIVLNAASGGVSIISFASVVGAPVGIAGASFTLIFFSNNRNNRKFAMHNKKKKEKA